jgi:deoxyadenosine/deoxycytidine kinase
MSGKIIHIDGKISSGKSTFCKNMKKEYAKLKVFIEPSFENPFLNDFYVNPKDYGYKIEDYLINYRKKIYEEAIKLKSKGYIVLLDGSIYKCQYFIDLNYNYEKNLTKDQHEKLTKYLNSILKKMSYPDTIVVLDRPSKDCLKTIEVRYVDNDALECEKHISIGYLENSGKCMEKWLSDTMNPHSVIKRYDWTQFGKKQNIKKIYKEILCC